jgi:hypothetical protein
VTNSGTSMRISLIGLTTMFAEAAPIGIVTEPGNSR